MHTINIHDTDATTEIGTITVDTIALESLVRLAMIDEDGTLVELALTPAEVAGVIAALALSMSKVTG